MQIIGIIFVIVQFVSILLRFGYEKESAFHPKADIVLIVRYSYKSMSHSWKFILQYGTDHGTTMVCRKIT